MSRSPRSSCPPGPLHLVTLALALSVPVYVGAEFAAVIDIYPWIEIGPLTLEWTTLVVLAFAVVAVANATRSLLTAGVALRRIAEVMLGTSTGLVAILGLVQLNTGSGGLYVAGMVTGLCAVVLSVLILVGEGIERLGAFWIDLGSTLSG